MSQLVRMDLKDGGSVLVEVADSPPSGPVTRGWWTDEIVTSTGATLEQALNGLGPVVKGASRGCARPAAWPDEVAVEFAIKLSADANVIIARSTDEANFKNSLRGTRRAT